MKKFKITIIGTLTIFILYIFYRINFLDFEIYNLVSYIVLLGLIFNAFRKERGIKVK